jgi:tetratricopeptide (TPR) repeat protein
MSGIQKNILIIVAAVLFPAAALAQVIIDGRIRTEDGRSPENMRVILLDSMYQQKGMAYAAADGRFVFNTVPGTNYNLQVDAGGTDYEPQTYFVQTGQNPYSSTGREMINIMIQLKLKDSIKRARSMAGAAASTAPVFAQTVPPAAKAAFDRAAKSLQKGDAGTAVTALHKALDIFADYYDALEALGAEFVRQHNYEGATPILRKAIQVNDRGWMSHYALGVALLELKQPADGISELRRATELNPQSPNAHMRLGLELAKAAETQADAIKEFEKTTTITGKGLPDAYFQLARLYANQKRYGESADALESYLTLVPNVSAEQKAQYRKAIEQLRAKAK